LSSDAVPLVAGSNSATNALLIALLLAPLL
jgi:hypothetical protein